MALEVEAALVVCVLLLVVGGVGGRELQTHDFDPCLGSSRGRRGDFVGAGLAVAKQGGARELVQFGTCAPASVVCGGA